MTPTEREREDIHMTLYEAVAKLQAELSKWQECPLERMVSVHYTDTSCKVHEITVRDHEEEEEEERDNE